MRDYELLYILPGDKSEDESTKITDEVNATLLKSGGKVEDENFWGRRKLAYPVAKQANGWYVVTRFSLDPAKLVEFREALALHPSVLRVLILHASEVPTAEESSRIEQAVQEADKEKESQEKPTVASPTPETVKRTAAAAPVKKAEEAKPETAEEKQERQAKLDEKLSEILKDE